MPKIKRMNQWKALAEYHETGDILLLQQQLGHKHVRSTWAYIQRFKPLLKLLGDHSNVEKI